MMQRAITLVLALTLAAATSTGATAFELSFDWGAIPRCTTGHPGIVPSPAFVLSDVPAGTARLRFQLTDLDVPGFRHGGGTVATPANGKVPFGAFTYKSPCPPGGRHTYEWTATALDAQGQALAVAKARLLYP